MKVGDSLKISDLPIAGNPNIEILTPLETVVLNIIRAVQANRETEEKAEEQSTEPKKKLAKNPKLRRQMRRMQPSGRNRSGSSTVTYLNRGKQKTCGRLSLPQVLLYWLAQCQNAKFRLYKDFCIYKTAPYRQNGAAW